MTDFTLPEEGILPLDEMEQIARDLTPIMDLLNARLRIEGFEEDCQATIIMRDKQVKLYHRHRYPLIGPHGFTTDDKGDLERLALTEIIDYAFLG